MRGLQFIPLSLLLVCLFFVGFAQAEEYLKITKSNSVTAYVEPSLQSKIVGVFKANVEVEIVLKQGSWIKVKIPYNEGFVYGWISEQTPDIQFITKAPANVPAPSPVNETKSMNSDGKPTTSKNISKEDEDEDSDFQKLDNRAKRSIKVFTGPVFSLHRYGAFQYRFGAAYEIPVFKLFRVGVPVSYLIGDGFSSIMAGLEAMYSFYFDDVAVVPKIGGGYEYFSGNGKSFYAMTAEGGAAVEYSVSKSWVIGIEPCTVQVMVWNSTSAINKIPLNIRGESLVFVRGRW